MKLESMGIILLFAMFLVGVIVAPTFLLWHLFNPALIGEMLAVIAVGIALGILCVLGIIVLLCLGLERMWNEVEERRWKMREEEANKHECEK